MTAPGQVAAPPAAALPDSTSKSSEAAPQPTLPNKVVALPVEAPAADVFKSLFPRRVAVAAPTTTTSETTTNATSSTGPSSVEKISFDEDASVSVETVAVDEATVSVDENDVIDALDPFARKCKVARSPLQTTAPTTAEAATHQATPMAQAAPAQQAEEERAAEEAEARAAQAAAAAEDAMLAVDDIFARKPKLAATPFKPASLVAAKPE